MEFTPNWPYDLTPEQEARWEVELHDEIEAASRRIVILTAARINDLLNLALAED